jgi:hypothetical protein
MGPKPTLHEDPVLASLEAAPEDPDVLTDEEAAELSALMATNPVTSPHADVVARIDTRSRTEE